MNLMDKTILHCRKAVQNNDTGALIEALHPLVKAIGAKPAFERAAIMDELIDTVNESLPQTEIYKKITFMRHVGDMLAPETEGRRNIFNRAVGYLEMMTMDGTPAGLVEVFAARLAKVSRIDPDTEKRATRVWLNTMHEIEKTDPKMAFRRAKLSVERMASGNFFSVQVRELYDRLQATHG